MLTLLRRSRFMALGLVLLTPGITGSAVQWLHSCPAESQSVADHQHHDPAPSDSGHSQGCECIAACSSAGAVAPAKALTILTAVVLPDYRLLLPTELTFVPAGLPSDLLPPATAPPLG